MQLQNFAPEARRDKTLETIESRKLSPQETALEMLRQGDREVTETKSGLEDLRQELKGVEDPSLAEQLKSMEADLDAAWEELSAETKAATTPETPTEEELAWEIPEEPAEKKIEAKTAAPTEEEMEWEMPEEGAATEGQEQGEATPQELIQKAFTGNLSPERLKSLLATEDGRWAAEDAVDDASRSLFEENVSGGTLEAFSRLASADTLLNERITQNLSERIGPAFAKRLIEDRGYRETISKLNEQLSGTLGEKGPALCSERNLENLVAINETFGENLMGMIASLDLQAYGPEKLSQNPEKDVIKVQQKDYESDGRLSNSKIELGLAYLELDEQGQPTNEFATINRSFHRKVEENPDGTTKTELTVGHELFELPPSFKGAGIAAEVTRNSLAEYDKMGADGITLHADIEQGGYAWASYGYGWDQDLMEPKNVREIVMGARGSIAGAYEEAGLLEDPKVQEMLKTLDEATEHPEAVTPQLLARIGKDGPFLRKGESGRWHTEESFKKALAEGEETGELSILKGPIHAGKIGLTGMDWYGRIDLKPDGPQKGANRKLLEAKTAKRT